MSKSINNMLFLLMFLFAQTFAYANSYVCSTDQAYIDYKAGNALNLDGATKYAGKGICENNCRSYTQCEVSDDGSGLYDCPPRKFENIGGNRENGSRFTSKATCNSKCYWQNSCVELVNNPCKIVNIELSNPVTDYTGKTVYTTRKVTHQCTNSQTKQVGCSKWKIVVNNESFDYNVTDEATVWKSRTSSDAARNTMAMLEQQLHIFSGWKGKCESGTMWNNPFSDPMAILGYAMMVYSAAGADKLGGAAKAAHNAVQNTFDKIGTEVNKLNPFGKTLSNADKLKMIKNVDDAKTISTLSSTTAKLVKMNTIATWDTGTKVFGTVKLLYTDIAQLAMALIPTNQEVQQAGFFNKAWMGDSDADDKSLAYAQCMASIGLSFPNLASYSADDMNNTSPELQNVYSNPIRLTKDQVAILMAATSETYVKNDYYPIKYDANEKIITYLARDQLAYQQAGQVICGGYLAPAINTANQEATPSSGGGGSTGGALGKVGIKMMISKFVPPPYNIIASVIFDVITSFESGDACHDKEIATKWGLDQLKTNQALNFDQCHHIKDECAAKWFWGSCMRDRHDYCCYDQISTRIFAEGLKEEMFPANDPKTGLPNPHIWDNCSISINDLKNISFRKCTADEQPYTDHCFPANKYAEFVKAINKSGVVKFDFEGAANQAINSLAIPSKVCHNNQ